MIARFMFFYKPGVTAAQQAQLAQLKELQAKLDEQRWQTQELHTALEQLRTARGAHA